MKAISFKRVNISQDREDTPDSDGSYGILDILNRDCLDHILSYVPILDIIRTERVSKRWQIMMQEHLEGELDMLCGYVWNINILCGITLLQTLSFLIHTRKILPTIYTFAI